MAGLVQRLGVGEKSMHPRELVSELRAGLRIPVRGIQAADEHAVRGGLQVPALRVGWIAGQLATSLHGRHPLGQDRDPVPRRLTDPPSAVPGGLDLPEREPSIGNFDLLQADDVGRRFGQPLQQHRQALGDVVDVEGRELERHQDPAFDGAA